MPLTIDGSYGEGGGQILRSSLTLSALTGRAVRLVNVRAGRSKPGLRPQHVTAVRAVAAITGATVEGDALGSQTLTFQPGEEMRSGEYTFDVADAARGGSAGSVMLILQAILLPLALASGPSRITLRGGTNVPGSPPDLYVEQVYLPMVGKLGVRAEVAVRRRGFYPRGGGELIVQIPGGSSLQPLELVEPGALHQVRGDAFVSDLPSHIPQRMTDRARGLLGRQDVPAQIVPHHVTALDKAAGLFLLAEYERARAGFFVRGKRGLPSERVAELAVEAFLEHHRTGAAVDPYLADQLVLPAIMARGRSRFTISKVTRHLQTNVWTAEQFDVAPLRLEGALGQRGLLEVG